MQTASYAQLACPTDALGWKHEILHGESSMGIQPAKTYTFDVSLFATVEVKAKTVDEARALLKEKVNGASCNAGGWPTGEPILFELSMDDGDSPNTLVSVDGNAV